MLALTCAAASATTTRVAPTLAPRAIAVSTLALLDRLYHVTSAATWDRIQREGALTPYVDRKDPRVRGVFTLERENADRNWTAPRTVYDSRRQPGTTTAIEQLMRYMVYRLENDHGFRGYKDGIGKGLVPSPRGLVTLEIQVVPEEPLLIRDNRHVIGPKRSANGFRASLKSYSELSEDERNNGMLEYILTRPVPVQRLRRSAFIPLSDIPSSNARRQFGPREIIERLFPVSLSK
ncbi:MAG: hypothetical protein HYZ74_02075 [Elusimicrobia bacterium]|nr:hypothetical protein [Elusimicrobiota bacterium]